jgi:hypothetical protein
MLLIKLFFFVLFTSLCNAYLVQRDSSPICTDLRAKSNDGDRKIAIVIDSSGSMAESDPANLRLIAGKSVVDWLISKHEATSTRKPDLVTVIDFDEIATLDYPLGDPAGADSSLDGIGADGGTFIAGGVELAIDQLTASGTGATSDRSGILVFTDGEVSTIKSSAAYISDPYVRGFLNFICPFFQFFQAFIDGKMRRILLLSALDNSDQAFRTPILHFLLTRSIMLRAVAFESPSDSSILLRAPKIPMSSLPL